MEFDLREFACGHVGLSEAYDTGKLKSRLRPAIHELESIEFIEPAVEAQRFRKVRPGVWRVRFEKRRTATKLGEQGQAPGRGASCLSSATLRRGASRRPSPGGWPVKRTRAGRKAGGSRSGVFV